MPHYCIEIYPHNQPEWLCGDQLFITRDVTPVSTILTVAGSASCIVHMYWLCKSFTIASTLRKVHWNGAFIGAEKFLGHKGIMFGGDF